MQHRTTRAFRPALAGALLWVGAVPGCGGAAQPVPAPSPASPADECVVSTGGDSVRPNELVLAVSAPHDSVLLSRQELEPPIHLDCLGRPRPGLASTWAADSTGRIWTLTVGDAGGLAQAWHGRPEATAALRWAGVQSVVPLDHRRLVVTFSAPHESAPGVFADPALAVPREGRLTPALRPVAFADPRDALDRGADLIFTADRTALDYAANRAGLAAVTLPWDRTYALLLPSGSTLGSMIGGDSARFRASLAAGAVQVDARGAEPPFWWESSACPAAPVTRPAGSTRSSAVIYERQDPVARALAERVVAMSDEPRAVTRAVDASELAARLHAGMDLAYLLALPRRALVPCREASGWPVGAETVALIDTRRRLILRTGLPPLQVDYDGAIRPAPTP